MPRIQAADMTRTNVFQAEKELVNLLDQGKQNLMSMIASPDLHNQMIAE
jgi:hypothetical protein